MNAFKCDVCKGFQEGFPRGTVAIKEALESLMEYQCCASCFTTISRALSNPNLVNGRLVP